MLGSLGSLVGKVHPGSCKEGLEVIVDCETPGATVLSARQTGLCLYNLMLARSVPTWCQQASRLACIILASNDQPQKPQKRADESLQYANMATWASDMHHPAQACPPSVRCCLAAPTLLYCMEPPCTLQDDMHKFGSRICQVER